MGKAPSAAAHAALHRRDDIQGLRGIAVLLVVLFHAGTPGLTGGFVGVDVFFVISGYLISGLLLGDIARWGRVDLPGFFARRARRLLPAAMVLLCSVMAVTMWLYPPIEQREWLSAARAASIYLSNFWFAGRALDYFAIEAHDNALLHTWSLAVEEQFYLVWPFAFVLLTLRRNSIDRVRQKLALGILGIAVVSLIACIWLTRLAQPWAFFGMPLRAWEFALGAMVVIARRRPQTHVVSELCAWFGLIAIAVAALLLREDQSFPGYLATLPAGGTALLLLGVREREGAVYASRLLALRPLVRLGDLSYSWYLWHWPVLVWTSVLWPGPSIWQVVCAVGLSLALAQASLRWVENPIRRARLGGLRSGHLVAVALSSSMLLALLAWGLMRWPAPADRADELLRFEAATGDRPRLYKEACHLFYFDTEPKLCAFGSTAAEKTVVLLGDSHAAQWFPALEALAIRWNWRLVSITKASCPALYLGTQNPALRRDYVECDTWREHALSHIDAIRPDLVVITSASYYPASPRDRGTALARILARLRGSTTATVVLRDTPQPGFNVPSCLARAAWRGDSSPTACHFPVESDRVWHKALASAEQEVISGNPSAYYVDLSRALCSASPCEVEQGGVVLFSDAHHLTASFARKLETRLAEALTKMLGPAHPLFSGAGLTRH